MVMFSCLPAAVVSQVVGKTSDLDVDFGLLTGGAVDVLARVGQTSCILDLK
jgi:hypothetical protein